MRFFIFSEYNRGYYAMLFSYIFKTLFVNKRSANIETTEYVVAITFNLLSSYYSKWS